MNLNVTELKVPIAFGLSTTLVVEKVYWVIYNPSLPLKVSMSAI